MEFPISISDLNLTTLTYLIRVTFTVTKYFNSLNSTHLSNGLLKDSQEQRLLLKIPN